MLFKILAVLLLIFITVSLFYALYTLVKNKGSEHTAKFLTYRIVLSVLLFIILIVGAYFGGVTPHGVNPNH